MDIRIKLGKVPKLSRPKLPDPETGLKAIIDRAPQAEAALERLRARFHPTGELLYSIRRRLATAAVGLLTVWLLVHVIFSANGMVAYRDKRTEIELLRKEVDSVQQENDTFMQQIKALKSDPKAIEKEAREQLHYARPGEVVFVAPSAAIPQSKPAMNSAKKHN